MVFEVSKYDEYCENIFKIECSYFGGVEIIVEEFRSK